MCIGESRTINDAVKPRNLASCHCVPLESRLYSLLLNNAHCDNVRDIT